MTPSEDYQKGEGGDGWSLGKTYVDDPISKIFSSIVQRGDEFW